MGAVNAGRARCSSVVHPGNADYFGQYDHWWYPTLPRVLMSAHRGEAQWPDQLLKPSLELRQALSVPHLAAVLQQRQKTRIFTLVRESLENPGLLVGGAPCCEFGS